MIARLRSFARDEQPTLRKPWSAKLGLGQVGALEVVASSDTAEVLGLSDTIATFYRGRLTRIRPQEEWSEDALTREVMHQEAAA